MLMDHIGQIPAIAAEKFGDREALVYEGRSFTFEELNDLVERAAGGLATDAMPPLSTPGVIDGCEWLIQEQNLGSTN